MKKIAIAFLLLISMSCSFLAAQAKVQLNLGFDFPGKHKFSYHGDTAEYDTDFGISPALEVVFPVAQQIMLGLGAEYQVERGIDEDFYGDFSPKYGFIPFYGTAKVQLVPEGPIIPELCGHVGYSFMYANDDYKGNDTVEGGFYFAIGGGIAINNKFVINMLYRYQSGSISSSFYDETTEITQTQFTMQISARI